MLTMAIACAALTAAIGPDGAAAATAGRVMAGSYANSAGTLAYEAFVPDSVGGEGGKRVPLVVALHGCTQTAAGFRALTRLDELAAKRGFVVVFPEQPKSRNQLGCWNWFQQDHMQRGAGEPSMIAGITNEVLQRYPIDPDRVYVTGLSAGGAMASVMGATYPDLFAAIGVAAGCEYAAGAACAGYKGTDPEQSARAAYQAMGSLARPVPFIVFQGDKDKTVPPENADQLVQSGQAIADWADDGARNSSIPARPSRTSAGWNQGGRSYTLRHYKDGHGHELAQYWMVHGMEHAWSGGDATQPYADPAGPDATAAMYDFFMDHAKR
jgi:poly(hydroxyalkanoate) depolymerase family esterase